MRTPSLLRRSAILLAMLALAGGCGRRVVTPTSLPGLAHTTANSANFHAYHLQAFHVQHIWAGANQGPDGVDYRAKVAVWDYTQENALVAEFYFHDLDHFEPAGRHRNPDPADAKSPLQIHFPVSTLGPMLDTLRTANERVYLYYARGEWAVGVVLPEGIGSG